jgi:hypothetical protein
VFGAEATRRRWRLPERVDDSSNDAFVHVVGLTAVAIDVVVRLGATPRSSETIAASELRDAER